MAQYNVFKAKFAEIYPLYLKKAERKGRSREELDAVIRWLTGYDQAGLKALMEGGVDMESFFARAPSMNPRRALIKGVVCGVRVEEVEDPLMREIRYLDRLVDELARGKALEKILR